MNVTNIHKVFNPFVFVDIMSKHLLFQQNVNNVMKLKNISLSVDFYKKVFPYYFDLKLTKFWLNEITDNYVIKHKIEKDLFYLIN